MSNGTANDRAHQPRLGNNPNLVGHARGAFQPSKAGGTAGARAVRLQLPRGVRPCPGSARAKRPRQPGAGGLARQLEAWVSGHSSFERDVEAPAAVASTTAGLSHASD